MSGVSTPSRRLSSTTTRVTPVSRRKAFSCSSAQIRELERNARALKVAAVVLIGVLSGWTSKVGLIPLAGQTAVSDAAGIAPAASRNSGGGSDATTPLAAAACPRASESEAD